MQPKLNPKRGQAATVVLLVILVLVFFFVIIGWLVYVMVKAIHKIKPPPDGSGGWSQPPPIGSKMDGGVIEAYVGAPDLVDFTNAPQGFVIDYLYIYKGSNVQSMTNLLIGPVPFNRVEDYFTANGLPIDPPVDGQPQPAIQFYKILVSGHYEP